MTARCLLRRRNRSGFSNDSLRLGDAPARERASAQWMSRMMQPARGPRSPPSTAPGAKRNSNWMGKACMGKAGEGAVVIDRALETGNSAIYAEYVREMALP